MTSMDFKFGWKFWFSILILILILILISFRFCGFCFVLFFSLDFNISNVVKFMHLCRCAHQGGMMSLPGYNFNSFIKWTTLGLRLEQRQRCKNNSMYVLRCNANRPWNTYLPYFCTFSPFFQHLDPCLEWTIKRTSFK